jgi:hypothetical protein
MTRVRKINKNTVGVSNGSGKPVQLGVGIILSMLKLLGTKALKKVLHFIEKELGLKGTRQIRQKPKFRVTRPVPLNVGTHITPSEPKVTLSEDSARVIGQAYIGQFVSDTNKYRIQAVPCNPIAWGYSNLLGFCQTYTHYKINHMTLHYSTAVPSTTEGQIVLSTRSTRDRPPSGFSNVVKYCLQREGSTIGPVWSSALCVPAEQDEERVFKCEFMADEGDESGSWCFIVADTNNARESDVTLGSLTIHYDIEFHGHRGINDVNMRYGDVEWADLAMSGGETPASGYKVGTIMYFMNQGDGVDMGDVYLYCGDRLTCTKLASTNNYWRLLDRNLMLDVSEITFGESEVQIFEPQSEG